MMIGASLSSWPTAAQEVLQLGVATGEGAPGSRAIAIARAHRALSEARKDYAQSRFSRCAERLDRAELQLQRHLQRAEDLALVKQVCLWQGLCRSFSDEKGAAAAYWIRATRIPGPGPDPNVFPPQAMKRYRGLQARRPGRTCVLRLVETTSSVQIDGKSVAAGELVEPDERYVIWSNRRCSARLRIPETCQLDLPACPVPPAGQVTAEEAQNRRFLQRAGRAAGAREVWLLHSGQGEVRLSKLDVASARFSERHQPLLSTTGKSPDTGTHPNVGQEQPKVWYKRWWVWTLIGAGVTAAVVIPVVATQEQRYDLVF
jgi:hypothetical protein